MIDSSVPVSSPCPYCGADGSFMFDSVYFNTVRLKFDCGTSGVAAVTKDLTLGRARYWIKRNECAWKAGFYRRVEKPDADVQTEQKELFTR